MELNLVKKPGHRDLEFNPISFHPKTVDGNPQIVDEKSDGIKLDEKIGAPGS